MRAYLIKVKILILVTALSWACYGPDDTVYVSTVGNDQNPGTEAKPVKSLGKALQLVSLLDGQADEYQIILDNGYYPVSEAVQIDPSVLPQDTSKHLLIKSRAGKSIISGAKRIKGWEQVDDNLWKVKIGSKRQVNQLFADGKRLKRARTPNKGFYYTKGPLTPYASICGSWGTAPNEVRFPEKAKLQQEHYDAFCGFEFHEGDINQEPDWENAEVLVYHSWEASWHSVGTVDHKKNDIWFHTPSRYPIGFFGNRTRYVIENLRSALDEPGEWYYDYFKGELFYLAREQEKVSEMDFFVPRLHTLMKISGTSAQKVRHLRFQKISFEHTRGVRGFYGSPSANWEEKHQTLFPDFRQDFRPGYMDAQAAPNAGKAIQVSFSSKVQFDSCRFSHLGGYGVSIEQGVDHLQITNCSFEDLGAGGILLGLDIRQPYETDQLTYEEAPQYVTLENNKIKNGGVFYKAAVGIWIAQSHHNIIRGNEVSGLPYTGISCGWTWKPKPNFTNHNLIEKNVIHGVLTELADGGGIYTLGQQPGSIISENVIYEIFRDPEAIGSHNNGMFFDESSSRFSVVNNHLFNIQDEPIRFNQTHPDSLEMTHNYFDEEHLPHWFSERHNK
ncbi:MAG: right-handed parallel beta-helix repeat-containing protein [Cyclobacteriaceae bacterium]|nr:right-handed parallel beta-helix repeat-containing protein [Cyclobacteriaceae bacterium HetDA_MAG_MS6]